MAQEIADSTLLDTWGSGGNIVEPDISKIIEGWQLGEQPPHEYMNWLQNTFGSKLNHILKNGVVKWNNETEYLAGSSVQHNGNVWLCKATNTNSEPTDVNANWKRIITIEALENLLTGYVATTGNQTIAGVKTFSSTIVGSINGNAGTATKLSTTRTNYRGITDSVVVGELMWKNYGNNSTVFDASNSTTPTGVAINNTNPEIAWYASCPTLMGYDGINTYGVRVDSSRFADQLKTARTINGVSFDGTANITITDSAAIGVGQTWQDVTSSRSAGVTYTNNTGKPIYVSVYTEGDLGGGNDAVLTIDGKVIAKSSTADASGTDESLVQGIVPNGSTYSYTRILGTTYSFFELR